MKEHKKELKLRPRLFRDVTISRARLYGTEPRVRAAVAGAPGQAAAGVNAGAVPIAAEAERPFRIPVSSEVPALCFDYYGEPYYEVLGHTPAECDLSRLEAGASVRDTHYGSQCGSCSDPAIEPGEMGNELLLNVGFMQSQLGRDFNQGVLDGHIQNVSLGYDVVGTAVPAGFADDGIPIYRFAWVPFHLAMTPDPEDFRVGFGRSADPSIEARTVSVQTPGASPKEERAMKNRWKPRMDGEPGGEPRGGAAASGASASGDGGGTATTDAPAAGGHGNRAVEAGELQQRARQEERERVSQIEDVSEANDMPRERVREWVEKGTSFAQVCRTIREERQTRGRAQASSEQLNGGDRTRPLVNVPLKDQKHYLVTRALSMGAQAIKPEGLELELSQEYRTRGYQAKFDHSIIIPLRLSEHRPELVERTRSVESLRGRAMGSTVAGGGAETVFERPGDLIEKIVAQNVLLGAGASISTDLTGPVAFPKETNDIDAYWTSENPPNPVPDTEMHFGIVNMSGRTLMTTMFWSRQWEKQASIDVENRGQNRMANRISRMLDKGGLTGTGTAGQVLGLLNTPGVLTPDHDPFSGIPTKAQLEAMIGAVADAEGDGFGQQGFLTTSKMFSAFRATPLVSAMPIYMATGTRFNGTLIDYPCRGSNQVPKDLGTGHDEHGLIYGTWSQCEFGTWGAIESVLDVITLARYGQRRLTLFLMADFVVKYPEAFCIAHGVKPS